MWFRDFLGSKITCVETGQSDKYRNPDLQIRALWNCRKIWFGAFDVAKIYNTWIVEEKHLNISKCSYKFVRFWRWQKSHNATWMTWQIDDKQFVCPRQQTTPPGNTRNATHTYAVPEPPTTRWVRRSRADTQSGLRRMILCDSASRLSVPSALSVVCSFFRSCSPSRPCSVSICYSCKSFLNVMLFRDICIFECMQVCLHVYVYMYIHMTWSWLAMVPVCFLQVSVSSRYWSSIKFLQALWLFATAWAHRRGMAASEWDNCLPQISPMKQAYCLWRRKLARKASSIQ